MMVDEIEYNGHVRILLTNYYVSFAPIPVFQVCEGVLKSL